MTPTYQGLHFYEKSHRYKLDGEWVPGVTTVLGVLNKPALIKWAANQVASYVADNRAAVEHLYDMGRDAMVGALKETPWQKRDEAGYRGNVLHDYAQRLLRGEELELDLDDEHMAVVESALAFMEDWSIEPILIEQACASRQHRWAGTLDLVADNSEGPRAIFDWKSGKRIYAEACFQLNAYAHAEFYGVDGDEHPMPELQIGAAYGVHIRADGYDVVPLEFGEHVYEEFLTIRRAFDIQKRAEGDWRVPGSGYVGRNLEPTPAGVSA